MEGEGNQKESRRGIRHLARQRALQLLYAHEFAVADTTLADTERQFLGIDRSLRRGWGPFARDLVKYASQHKTELDQAIAPLLKNWTLERLPLVDRICLQLALSELQHFADIPLRVTINEYIELARHFGNDDSPVYINAVLDRLSRQFPQKDFQVSSTDEGHPVADKQPDPNELPYHPEEPEQS